MVDSRRLRLALVGTARASAALMSIDPFEEARAEEDEHLENVRAWLAAAQNRDQDE